MSFKWSFWVHSTVHAASWFPSAGDNDDAWAGARQLSGQREPAPTTRSQVRQGWDKILCPALAPAPTGMAAPAPTLSLTPAPATPDPLPRYKLHLAPLSLSQLGSSSTSPWLRERGEMSASGSGGSGATQPGPLHWLQSLLSLSAELRASSSALLTLLVAGTKRESRCSLYIDKQGALFRAPEQWPQWFFVVIVGIDNHMSPQWPGIVWKHCH